jgi:hypothetical protein
MPTANARNTSESGQTVSGISVGHAPLHDYCSVPDRVPLPACPAVPAPAQTSNHFNAGTLQLLKSPAFRTIWRLDLTV